MGKQLIVSTLLLWKTQTVNMRVNGNLTIMLTITDNGCCDLSNLSSPHLGPNDHLLWRLTSSKLFSLLSSFVSWSVNDELYHDEHSYHACSYKTLKQCTLSPFLLKRLQKFKVIHHITVTLWTSHCALIQYINCNLCCSRMHVHIWNHCTDE